MSDPLASLIPSSLVPSGVRDERQHALAQVFGEALAELDPGTLLMADPLTVDERLLPFLVHEYGAQDFIVPDLPVHLQRQILSNIWQLKSLHGYDAGVKLGLELIGMDAEIVHWHQTEPKGPANTQILTITSEEAIFPASAVPQLPRELGVAKRIVEASKRFSQDVTVRFGWVANAHVWVATAVATRVTQEVDAAFPSTILAQFAGTAVAVRMTQEIPSHG